MADLVYRADAPGGYVGRLAPVKARKLSRRDRIRAQLAHLKLPGALDPILLGRGPEPTAPGN